MIVALLLDPRQPNGPTWVAIAGAALFFIGLYPRDKRDQREDQHVDPARFRQ